jgi:hypothetical protein
MSPANLSRQTETDQNGASTFSSQLISQVKRRRRKGSPPVHVLVDLSFIQYGRRDISYSYRNGREIDVGL